MTDIHNDVAKMPALPGIYIIKDNKGVILYVGKAKILKNRVKQYFQNISALPPKTKLMISLAHRIESISTQNEAEALILERNLIKKHRPRYNVLLKDDKNYPVIKVTVSEEYPRVIMTRKVENDGSRYFGPYTSAFAVREALELISEIYPLKSCKKKLPADIGKERPCLNYQMGKCLAPCQGDISKTEYRKLIDDVCRFLEGDSEKTIKRFETEMLSQAELLNFEKAGVLRDRINSLKNISEKQRISLTKAENGDFIACYGSGIRVSLQIFFLRGRNITGRKSYFLDRPIEKTDTETISEFMLQYYDDRKIIPSRIYVQEIPEDNTALEAYLESLRKRPVKIIQPKRGEKRDILGNAAENAKLEYEKDQADQNRNSEFFRSSLDALSQFLSTEEINKVEAFDVSNTSGNDTVAAKIAADGDGFDKKSYRRYTVKTVSGTDDYGAMAEAVSRRFRKSDSEDAEKRMPDLLLVDGSAGHVNKIKMIAEETGIAIRVAGMVKDDKHKTRGLFFEGDFFEIRKDPEILRFITVIQDEIHRFTHEFNLNKRKKRVLSSELDGITGIGEARKRALLKKFGSVKKLREAEISEIAETKGIGSELAEKIRKGLIG